MTLSQLLKRLKMTKKPELQKELLLQAWNENENFYVGLNYSCDPTYVVKADRIAHIDEDDGDPGNFSFKDFIILFDKVTQVDIEPKEARSLIIDAANVANVQEWNNFYRRILQKKLQDDVPMEIVAQILSEITGKPIQAPQS